jgi:hypothetical protein
MCTLHLILYIDGVCIVAMAIRIDIFKFHMVLCACSCEKDVPVQGFLLPLQHLHNYYDIYSQQSRAVVNAYCHLTHVPSS